ncbi:toprim domain-containing protein [Candidatus Nitrosocosmicus hydrocola]|uniref:toprim domain-containing protein n=1 Tax=Candidatus Nitrosocosmicus hydrocola TaxID=1826872 RepID=UPI0011E5A48D|nr:toprim domain-containing protein [Candidatus Nitrosocosmicus hydrocola]
MDRREKLRVIREINEFVNQINSESVQESLILVEGKKDLEALSYLGCNGNIRMYHNFKNPIDVVDKFRDKYKKLIILLDLDRTGEIMTKKIYNMLSQRYIDQSYRMKLLSITQGRIKNIEELKSFYDSMQLD